MSTASTRVVRVRPRTSGAVAERDPELAGVVRARLGTDPAPRVSAGRWTPRRVLVLAVAVLGSLLVLQAGIGLTRSEPVPVSTTPLTSVASDAVQSILQMSGGGALNTRVFTQELGSSLAGGSESFLADLQGSGYRVSGGPIASGVLEQSEDTASVIVATTGDIRDASGQAVSTHTLTFEVGLVREGGSWLVGSMEVVS